MNTQVGGENKSYRNGPPQDEHKVGRLKMIQRGEGWGVFSVGGEEFIRYTIQLYANHIAPGASVYPLYVHTKCVEIPDPSGDLRSKLVTPRDGALQVDRDVAEKNPSSSPFGLDV